MATWNSQVSLPNRESLLWPTLAALRELGGSGGIGEINDTVIADQHLSDEQQRVLHLNGPQSEIAYVLAWVRTYLKNMGLIAKSSRGVWVITPLGATVEESEIKPLLDEFSMTIRKARSKQEEKADRQEQEEQDDAAQEENWKDDVLEALLAISPAAFERLAKRLLREAGFVNVMVLGKSNDGGLDGVGIFRMSLISFPVFFQCKRYRGSVGSGEVRDFRGAMAGRGDKGLLITTGAFTRDAKNEATRDGAPPVDLVDGQELCDLLKRYELGVKTTIHQKEEVTVDAAYFQDV